MAYEKLEEIWGKLKTGIDSIFNRQASGKQYMNLYTEVHNYCTFVDPNSTNYVRTNAPAPGLIGEELYERISDLLKNYTLQLKSEAELQTGSVFLDFTTKNWEHFKFSARIISGICAYLNRNWVQRQIDEGSPTVTDIYTLGLNAWKEYYIKNNNKKISEAIIEEIYLQRQNNQKVNIFGKKLIECLVEIDEKMLDRMMKLNNLGQTMNNQNFLTNTNHLHTKVISGPLESYEIYRTCFETPFISETEKFYANESQNFLEHNSVVEYLKKVEVRIKEEEERIGTYIENNQVRIDTQRKLEKVINKVLLENHMEEIYKEFDVLLKNDMDADLARMFILTSRIPTAIEHLAEKFEQHVINQGEASIREKVEAAQNPTVFVECILNVIHKNTALTKGAFNSNANFKKAFDKACVKFINRNAVTEIHKSNKKSAEYLAKYCDTLLKKSTSANIEDSIADVITVFKYLDDKDVFQSFYSKTFARRLINDMGNFDDTSEGLIIQSLREAAGYEYIHKMHRMLNDRLCSDGLIKEFRGNVAASKIEADLNVIVLSSNTWPFSLTKDVELHSTLIEFQNVFNRFYLDKHNGRKLIWCNSLGRGEIITNYTRKPYIFQVSNYQISILMLFNDSLTYTVKELIERSKFDGAIVHQIVGIFLKGRALVIGPPESDNKFDPASLNNITDDTQLSLYTNYNNKTKTRVNFNVALKSDMKQEVEDVNQRVDSDRELVIKACIVRIMKARKVLRHNELISAVCDQLIQFKPTVMLIKKIIENLLHQSYIARDQESKDTYRYIA